MECDGYLFTRQAVRSQSSLLSESLTTSSGFWHLLIE
jgi:hypothetical protein